jgi:hypothetical protein
MVVPVVHENILSSDGAFCKRRRLPNLPALCRDAVDIWAWWLSHGWAASTPGDLEMPHSFPLLLLTETAAAGQRHRTR